jgi:hypothetical protein
MKKIGSNFSVGQQHGFELKSMVNNEPCRECLWFLLTAHRGKVAYFSISKCRMSQPISVRRILQP